MTGWTVETLLATTLLMLLVLALRPWVTRRFGPRTAYLLWSAPALRMVMPPLPVDWTGDGGMPLENVAIVFVGASSLPAEAPLATSGSIDWPLLLGAAWLAGAALVFLRHWLAYVRFSRRAIRLSEAVDGKGDIRVSRSPVVASPIALGIFGKRVIVPLDFEHRFDADERRLALAHEAVHHRRRDVLANFAALATLSLHWFNPVAHIAHRAFRLDQEAACDAVVLAGASTDDRHAYGSALFKSAMGSVPLAACAMGGTATLKARLRRIVSSEAEPGLSRSGIALAAIIIGGGIAFTASGQVAEPVAPLGAPRAIVIGGGVIDRPSPQAMPVLAMARSDALAEHSPRAGATVPASPASDASGQPPAPLPPTAATGARPPVAPGPAGIIPDRPSAPAAPDAPLPPRPLALSCDGKFAKGVILRATSSTSAETSELRIFLCEGGKIAHGQEMLNALASARLSLASDPMIAEAHRARIVAALDRQIRRLDMAESGEEAISRN